MLRDFSGAIQDSVIAGRDVIQNFVAAAGRQRDDRNRRALLDQVATFWIDGVLEKSIHHELLIDLGKRTDRDAIDHPWQHVLMTAEADEVLPHAAAPLEMLRRAANALLILGEPGSGKTITLLEIAREALDQARVDPAAPIPIVLNLSSWGQRPRPLVEWLTEELNDKYHVPARVARKWLRASELLLLLDGLDEVVASQQAPCVDAINAFLREHGLISIVVCGRISDYQSIGKKLRFRGAVRLQPLTSPQIASYLDKLGEDLSGLRTVIEQGGEFAELARTPFMLSVMSLTYRGYPANAIQAEEATPAQGAMDALFTAYVSGAFQKRLRASSFAAAEIEAGLSWLARKLLRHSHTTFAIEDLQPSWLAVRKHVIWYGLVSRAMLALGVMVSWSLAAIPAIALIRQSSASLGALLMCMVNIIVTGSWIGYLDSKRMYRDAQPLGPQQVLDGNLPLKGFVVAMVIGSVLASSREQFSILSVWVVLFLPLGALLLLRNWWSATGRDILPVDSIRISWRRFGAVSAGVAVTLAGLTFLYFSNSWRPTYLWDDSGKVIAELPFGATQIDSVAFSEDGQLLAGSDANGVVHVTTGSGIRVMSTTPHQVRSTRTTWQRGKYSNDGPKATISVRFSTDDRHLMVDTGAYEETWDVDSGTLIATTALPAIVTSHEVARRSAAETKLELAIAELAMSKRLRLRLTEQEPWERSNRQATRALELDSDGNLYGSLSLLDISGGAKVRIASFDGVLTARFSPDGERLCVLGMAGVQLVDAVDGRLLNQLESADSLQRKSTSLWGWQEVDNYPVFNSQSTRLATISDGRTIKLWDATTGRLIRVLEGQADSLVGEVINLHELNSVFSADGTRLHTVSNDGTTRVYDAGTGEVLTRVVQKGTVYARVSPSGDRVVPLVVPGSTQNDQRHLAAVWLPIGVLIGLLAGIRRDVVTARTFPNQGLWRSATNGGVQGLLVGITSVPATAIVLLIMGRNPFNDLDLVAATSLFLTLVVALWGGWIDVINSVALRLVLVASGATPWNFRGLLDKAVACALLRRVGGDYIFMHRLMLEYFSRR